VYPRWNRRTNQSRAERRRDRIRTECRLKMLEHFYEVAAVMPEEKRRKYLQIVLPVVLNPGGPSNLNASIAR
jgi:head-tail adaptor